MNSSLVWIAVVECEARKRCPHAFISVEVECKGHYHQAKLIVNSSTVYGEPAINADNALRFLLADIKQRPSA